MSDAPRELRSRSRQLSVYNDGPWVFLYDALFEAELRALRASGVLVGDHVDADVAAEIRKRDLLVVYELQQDDPIEVELAVGGPLTREEKNDLPYLPPREARLHLPTGRLRLESLNALSIHEDEPTEPGAEIELQPGLYMVRVESLELGHDEIAEADAGWPSEFISLEPIEGDAGVGLDPLIALDTGRAGAAAGEVRGDTFRGATVKSPTSPTQTVVNLGPAQADEMGLTMGQRLQVRTVQGPGQAAYSRFMTIEALERLLGRRALATLCEQGVDWIAGFGLLGGALPHVLDLTRVAAHRQPTRPPVGTDVTVQALPTPGLPELRDDLLDKARMKKGRFQAQVLFARPGAFLLNAPFPKLRKIGIASLMTKEPPILAAFGERERLVYFDRRDRPEALDEARAAFFSRVAGGENARAEMERLEDAHRRAERKLAAAMRGHGSESEIAELSANVDTRASDALAHTLPAELADTLPLAARIFPSWRQPDENTLLVEPIIGIRTGLDVSAGSVIELYRQG